MILLGIVCWEISRACTVLTALAAVTFIVLLPMQSVAQSVSPRYLFQECRMNVCEWTAISDKQLIKENNNGKLIGVTALGCSTNHPSGIYPKRYVCKSSEVRKSSYAVFCSTGYPAIAFKNEENRKWTRNRLVISQDGVGGYLIHSLNIYLYVCHGVLGGAHENLDFLGAKLGYRASSLAEPEQDEIDSILDLMR